MSSPQPQLVEETIRETVLLRGLVDTCRMVRGGSFAGAFSIPVVGGWIAFAAGTDLTVVWVWSAAVVVISLITGVVCHLALRSLPWANANVWSTRLHVCIAATGIVNSFGVLLVDPWKGGSIDPLWSVSLMMFSAMLAGNALIGFGIRTLFPVFSAPVVVSAIVSCARLGGWLGGVLAFGCVVYFFVIAGTNRIAGDAFRRSTTLRVRNERLVRDLEAANELLEHRAHSDALTGLANRAGLWSELERRLSDPEETTVLFIDLDGFKPINDQFGHTAGDEVLRIVADRLSSIVRSGDIVARMGGDEFVVIANGFEDSDAETFGDRVRQVIEQPMVVHGNTLSISAAIGVATHQPENTMQTTLAEADKLMYAMKRAHRLPI